MEEIIAEFEAVMAEYNEAYTSTGDGKEQEKIDKKYESIISKAETEMEDAIQAFNKAQDDALLAEQKASEDEIKELEKEEEDSLNDSLEEQEDAENTNDNHPLVNTFKKLVREGVSAADISKQFKEVELIEIGKEYNLAFTSKGNKLDKVKLIIEVILK